MTQADRPLLIKHKSTECYYTSTAWANEKSTHTQGRQTHHESSTGLQSPTTPGYYDLLKNLDILPANQAQVYRALLHHETMSYWEIDTYQLQIDLMPIEHNLQSTTTPGQYELLKNQHIPKSDRAPLLIEQKSTEPY